MQPPRAASRGLGLLSPSPFWIFFSSFSFDQTGRDARCGTGDAAEWRSHVHLLWEIKLPGLNSSGAAGGLPKTPGTSRAPPDVGWVPGGAGGPHPCRVCTREAGGCCCSAVTGEHHGGGDSGATPRQHQEKYLGLQQGFQLGFPCCTAPQAASAGDRSRQQPRHSPGTGGGDTHEPLAREVEGEGGALGPTGARPHMRAAPAAACPDRSFGKRTLGEHFPLWMLEPRSSLLCFLFTLSIHSAGV